MLATKWSQRSKYFQLSVLGELFSCYKRAIRDKTAGVTVTCDGTQ